MRKHPLLLLLVLFFISSACKQEHSYTNADSLIIDSFEIEGIEENDELLFMNEMNDSTIYSYDRISNFAKLYRKYNTKIYSNILSKELNSYANTGINCFQYNKSQNKFYYIDGEAKIIETLDTGFNLISKYTVASSANEVAYRFNSIKAFPIIFTANDTLLVNKTHADLSVYFDFIKNGTLSKLALVNDSAFKISDNLEFPKNIGKFFKSFAIYCQVDDKIYGIYSNLNTIHIYNLVDGVTRVEEIDNNDFVAADSFDFSKVNSEGFTKELTRHELFNFQYYSIIFNPVTNHFLLFYKKPDKISGEGMLPSYDDQTMYILVLDKNLKRIKNLSFPKSKYMYAPLFLTIHSKGIAVPKLNRANEKKLKFYIFNL